VKGFAVMDILLHIFTMVANGQFHFLASVTWGRQHGAHRLGSWMGHRGVQDSLAKRPVGFDYQNRTP